MKLPKRIPAATASSEKKPASHEWGILSIDGRIGFPGLNLRSGMYVAHESLIYDAYGIQDWASTVSDDDLTQLEMLCTNQGSQQPIRGIVFREYDGCSIQRVDAKMQPSTLKWSLAVIAREGTQLGKPDHFWSQEPNSDEPPEQIGCASRVPIQVQLISLSAYCTQVVLPLETDSLKRQILALRRRLSQRCDAGNKMDELLNSVTQMQRSAPQGIPADAGGAGGGAPAGQLQESPQMNAD